MSTFLQDVRYAIRILAKAPTFTAAAILTLALTIGVNTAVFSLVNKALLEPLPFDDSDRLMWLFRESRAGQEVGSISHPDYLEYRDRSGAFEQLAAFSLMPLTVGRGSDAETRIGQIVTGNYFATLGLRASLGRTFTVEDDRWPGGHPVVVVSHRYWASALGGRPGAVGETMNLSGHPFTIVGVAPEGFAGAIPVPAPDLWVPMMMLEQLRPAARGRLADRDAGFLWVLGKLKPGLSAPEAEAELAVTSAQLEQVDPDHFEEERASIVPALGVIPMTPETRRIVLALSTLLLSAVGLVLLVGCANVANLILSRATSRRREFGIRMALGAPRARMVRQLLTESFLLAAFGGLAGLILATWTMDLLVSAMPQLPFNVTLDLDFGVDRRILTFTALASTLSVLLFGLLPAIASTRVNPVSSLREEGGSRHFGWRRSRVRSALVVGQVAMSLVLLVGAGLFLRSLMRAQAIDPGFRHENVLTVMMDLGSRGHDDASSRAFVEGVLERSRALPGVASASVETSPPLTLGFNIQPFWIEGRPYTGPDAERLSVASSRVSDGGFRTLAIPLLRGRDFAARDTANAPQVAIVNQAFVDRHWPDQDPIGKRLSTHGAAGPYLSVVGIAKTARYWMIGEEPRPFVYLPLLQGGAAPRATLLVRTEGDPMAALPGVRAILLELDPDLSPWGTSRLTDLIGLSLLPARLAAAGFLMFGLLALLLASVGLYGIMSYMVAQRTHEVGVRMAIGARAPDVLKLILRHGLALTAAGVGIGLLGALACTRVLSSLLYEVSVVDPWTFVGVSLLLAAIALLACYVPAHRATKTDPLIALRAE